MSTAEANISRSLSFTSRNARAGRPAQIHPAFTSVPGSTCAPAAMQPPGSTTTPSPTTEAIPISERSPNRPAPIRTLWPIVTSRADDHVAARAIGDDERVVLHVGPLAHDDARSTGGEHTAIEDARIVCDLHVADEHRRRRDERTRDARRSAVQRVERTLERALGNERRHVQRRKIVRCRKRRPGCAADGVRRLGELGAGDLA